MVKQETEEEDSWEDEEGANIAKQNTTQELDSEEDEVDTEEEEDEQVPKRGRPKKAPVNTAKRPLNTFSAYHIPERAGVKNNRTGQPVGEDVYSLLALILTKLESIEEELY